MEIFRREIASFTVQAPPQEVYKRCLQINEMPCLQDARLLPYIEQGKQTTQTTELKLRLNGEYAIFSDATIHLSFQAHPIYETMVNVTTHSGFLGVLLLLAGWWMIVIFCILVALNRRYYEAVAIIFLSQYALSCFYCQYIMQKRDDSINSLLMSLFPSYIPKRLFKPLERSNIQLIGQNYRNFAFESSKSIASISKFLKAIDRPHIDNLILETRQVQIDENRLDFTAYVRRYPSNQSDIRTLYTSTLIHGRAFIDKSGVMRIKAYTELPYDFFTYSMIALNAFVVLYLALGQLGNALILVGICFLLGFWMTSRSYLTARKDQELLMERLYQLLA